MDNLGCAYFGLKRTEYRTSETNGDCDDDDVDCDDDDGGGENNAQNAAVQSRVERDRGGSGGMRQ